MKRNALTLIELIITIIIIGVLAVIAVPQYKNLKQNAEVKNVLKTTIGSASNAVNAAVKHISEKTTVDASDMNLSTLISIRGKGWSYTAAEGAGTYIYKDADSIVSTISLDATNRTVNYTIHCAGFKDSTSQSKCYTSTESNATNDLNITLTF